MKRALFILACLGVGLILAAQEPGPGGDRPPRPNYDASKEVTLQGTVITVNLSSQGPGPFVTLSFLAETTTYEVMVGPQALLARNQVSLAQGDILTIVGVAGSGPQGTRFMARSILKEGTLVTLLNQDGSPAGRP